jgi:dipeptidyl aminopeptidase/acylaminoacyl peptidase
VTARTAWDVWTLDLESGQTRALVEAAGNQSQSRISPDGRYLAYASDESGAWNVYVQPFPDGSGRWHASPDGGSQPQWRADGSELYYVAPDGRLVAVQVTVDPVFAATARTTLFQANLPQMVAPFRTQYAVAPDGDHFLLNTLQPDVEAAAITIVLDWRPGD